MVGKRLLHYTITAEIGGGGMGRVYRARDEHTGRDVAIKILGDAVASSAEARERLILEARAAARLSHPGVVTLHAVEEADGELFLVQQYVEGETLAARLARGPLGTAETLRLGRELAAALAHAHANGVLHRDLKPDNVLVATDGSHRVADFGIARLEGVPGLTQTGQVVGTPGYVAPERLRGAPGDTRADLFSLGVILYEALAGRKPFGGDSDYALMFAVMNEEPAPVHGPAPLVELIGRLLAKEPGQRPESAAVVEAALHGMQSGATAAWGATAPAGAPGLSAAGPARSRRLWPVAAVAAGIIAVLAVAGWVLRGRLVPPAQAEESSIAVLSFENVADPSDATRMGPITGNLLVTSLAQRPELNVLSTQRILDAMRQVGLKGGAERSRALEVARRARATRLVTGTILQVEPIVLTAEIADVRTGRVLFAERVNGGPGETVFQLVDALSARLLQRMARPSETTIEPVAQRGSADLEANRHYVQGLDHLSGGRFEAAAAAFDSAIARDPDFAQAHLQLALSQWWQAEPLAARASIAQVKAHADRLSPLERATAEGIERLAEHDWPGARQVFRRLAAEYPEEKMISYGQVEAEFHDRRWNETIDASRRTLAIDPDFTLAGIHYVGALNEIKSYAAAESISAELLARDPRNVTLWLSRLVVRISAGDEAGFLKLARAAREAGAGAIVRDHVVVFLVNHDLLAEARAWPSFAAAYQPWAEQNRLGVDYLAELRAGRFRAAEAIADRAWKILPISGQPFGPALPEADGIDAAQARHDRERVLELCDSLESRLRRWQGPEGEIWARLSRVEMLAELGDARAAAAVLAKVEARPEIRAGRREAEMDYARAIVLLARGRAKDAAKLVDGMSWYGVPAYQRITTRVRRAQVLLAAGQPATALPEIEAALRVPVLSPMFAVRAHLLRGKALEQLHRPSEAAQAYRTLLRIWRDADPGNTDVAEARAALARLQPNVPVTTRAGS